MGQSDQGHDRPSREKGTPEDSVPFSGEGEEAEDLPLEDQEPEDRKHDAGVPATISTPDSTARASHLGRANSLSQTAVATPSGTANAVPIKVRQNSSDKGIEEPAAAALVELGQRMRGQHSGADTECRAPACTKRC